MARIEVIGTEAARAVDSARSDPSSLGRDPLRRRMLAAADAVAVTVAGGVTLAVFDAGMPGFLWAALWLPVWIVLAKLHGLYDRDHRTVRHLTVDELPAILVWAVTGTAAFALFSFAAPFMEMGVPAASVLWSLAAAAALAFRSAARSAWRRITPAERVLVVGDGALAQAVRRKLELFPEAHASVVSEVEPVPPHELLDGLLDGVDRVVVASRVLDEALLASYLDVCRRGRMKLTVVPPARALFGTAVQLNHLADLPLVEYNTWDASRSTLLLKRVLDVTVAVLGLVLLAPVALVVAVAIKLDSGGPILFRQLRAGRDGRPFTMLKFRTMVRGAEDMLRDLVLVARLEEPAFKLRDDPRVTRVGRFLRRASIDELPQLLNVLRGEMSLVGPRPEQLDVVELYRPEHRFRLQAKPGMTGPMQVFGRGDLSFDERLAVEREYIENLSLGRDLRLIALTIAAVGRGGGAY